jgi:hypothetical protein
MMDRNTLVRVKNRSASSLVYKVPDLGVRREFNPGEVKRISIDELEKLSYVRGGESLIANFLQILDTPEVIEEVNGGATELEYNWGEKEVVDLIKNGSVDAFLDALDFAPAGVIDLIKTFSVSLPITDLNKIHALKEKTGFDVETAIKLEQADKAEEEPVKPPVKKRRAKSTTTTTAKKE